MMPGRRRAGALARPTLFLGRLLAQCLPALARPRLVMAQIYNAGARSLIIIMLAGLFVGMVLALQGYDLLQRFGSEEALGTAAALGLLQGARSGDHRAAVRRPRRHLRSPPRSA